MSKPPGALVVTWRDLANEGRLYVEIQRKYPKYTVNQIRHYCLGSSGQKLPGPVQKPDRWNGHNVWLQGEKSPHAELSSKQANEILDDWDEEAEKWTTSGAQWARKLGVSASTIHMLRRGETWGHLQHENQGKTPRSHRKKHPN